MTCDFGLCLGLGGLRAIDGGHWWLEQAGDLMLRAAPLVKSDEDFEKYTLAME